jgi:AraC-like DNA-binding protein
MTLVGVGAKSGATREIWSGSFAVKRSHFGQWRLLLRVMEAMKYLAMNEPVTSVAMKVGYSSPSAFIAVFKRFVGSTPGEYFG